jgi:hypothetical protein
VFEMARCEGSQPATQTLVLAMQFSRSAPRPVRLEAAVRARERSSTAVHARSAGGGTPLMGSTPSKQSSEVRRSRGPVVPEPARLHETAGGDIRGRTVPQGRVASDRRGNFLAEARQCVP